MKGLVAREKAGELSDHILRKQPTGELVKFGLWLTQEANIKRDRADRVLAIAHDVAEERGEYMGVDGI